MLKNFMKKYKSHIYQVSPYYGDKASNINYINHSWIRNYDYEKVFLEDLRDDSILVEIPNCFYGDYIGSISNLCNYRYFEKNYPDLIIECGNEVDGNTLYFSLLKFIKMDRKENWLFAKDFDYICNDGNFDDEHYEIEQELIEENLGSWLARDIASTIEKNLGITFLEDINLAGTKIFYEYLYMLGDFNIYWEYTSIAWYASNFQEHLEGITKETLDNLNLKYEEN